MPPLLSVVTATLNRRDFLPRCLDSVAAQDYPHKEHWVIDGGSTDGTSEVLTEYAQRYPHLHWISEKDSGLSEALNKGLARATGDAVGVLGDDDYYLPGTLARVAAEFARQPGLGLVSGSCDQVRNDGSLWVTLRACFTTHEQLLQPWRYWGRPVMLPAPSTFISRAALDSVGGFDEQDRYAMDYRHWVKITKNFPVQTMSETLAVFRCGEGTLSFSANRKQRAETMQISREYWGSPRDRDFWRFLASYLRYYQWQRVLDRLQRLRR